MQHFISLFRRISGIILPIIFLLTGFNRAQAQPQPLKITDFAIWGGGAPADPYNSGQGVSFKNSAFIEGNVGSNHLVDFKNTLDLKGNIYSGNGVSLKDNTSIIGNIFAARAGSNFPDPVISGGISFSITGNMTANGKIVLGSGSVNGQVSVPAPSATNYTGPNPSGGVNNNVVLPALPSIPNNTPFDNVQVGTIDVKNTQTISPGVFRKLALTGNRTLTFNGPGNYIFNEVDNGNGSNKLVFDFKNTTSGTINIFIITNARWGKLSVSTKNGNFPSRVYTEIHGNGAAYGGFTFLLQGPDAMPAGSYNWIGNIWAPNGAISIEKNKFLANNAPNIIGAIWSAKMVDIKNDMRLVYIPPAADPVYVDPYYPPPGGGKVASSSNKIGAELQSLSQNSGTIGQIPDNEIFIIDNGKVMIEVISKKANDDTLARMLDTLGMTNIIDNGPHSFVITGNLLVNKVSDLNSIPWIGSRIEYVRPLYPAINNVGRVTTQGDGTMRSNFVRERFGVDGSGVKIGVLSDSYNNRLGAQSDVDEGDLPGIKSNNQPNENPTPVQVLLDLQGRGSDEGRAMLQIVHDIAPKAKLAFRTGFLSAGDFAKGIQELASPTLAGGPCDVIVEDLNYVTEPYFTDGIVAQTVNQVVAQGVTYLSSAGNFGDRSHEDIFRAVENLALAPAPARVHQFGPTSADVFQSILLKPGSYTIVLQWDNPFHSLGSLTGVDIDLDLFLVGSNGFTLFGFNRSNLFGDPFEVCPFTVKESTNAKLMVVSATGATNVRFKYIIFRGDATIENFRNGTSTIVGQANSEGSIAVGAMLYDDIQPYTPDWPGVASFSSRGGTPVRVNGSLVTRNKPEIIAPNGANTTVDLGGVNIEGDPFPNFFGTSASAPHAAGVAALLIQARKKFNQQATVTPAEIRQMLITSAGKFNNIPSNEPFVGGYGYVQADSAVSQIANARPIINSLGTADPGDQNGTDSFQVKIKGKYLTPGTRIFMDSVELATTVSADNTEATAMVPALLNGEDPAFYLNNPHKSPSEEDGGNSDSLYFFSSITKVLVEALDTTRKYGQINPDFKTRVRLIIGTDTVPLSQTNISLADLKLDADKIKFRTFATPKSGIGNYGITPYRDPEIPNDDPVYAQYRFVFVPGNLSIGKMPVKITPENRTVYYGDDLGEITFEYELDQTLPTYPGFLDDLKALHKKNLADNALVVLNGYNSQTIDLTNMSIMASFQSVRNARKFVLQNGQLQALVNDLDVAALGVQRFLVDVSATSLANYQLDSAHSEMVPAFQNGSARAFLNIKALAKGNATAELNGQLQPMVNGQLVAMVNGQLQALVNGQLQALVNGQLMPLVNGQLVAMVNGQLQPMVNGQLLALVNGQLMALVNGELHAVQDLTKLPNGQLQALVNGQLQALVNGQLQAMVNGVIRVIPNADVNLVNGQLQALVNGQLQALVNGQLQAIVNGQLQPLVNGDAVAVNSIRQLANGQLQALVNGTYIPIANGQLQALVNGQLLAMVNGQLMALVNGELTFAAFANGQLQALVNGQLQPLVNGQLQALVNGQLQPLVNSQTPINNSYRIVNGQLQAIVNNQPDPWVYANGQLLALVNGQLQALVNNFDVAGTNNNAETLVLIDEDDISEQYGSIGTMFAMNMITGLDVGVQKIIPGAFVNQNIEATYGTGEITILKKSLIVTADNKTKIQGEPNPTLTVTYHGLVNGDNENIICSGSSAPVYIRPPSPVTIEDFGRATLYTEVKLNGDSNVVIVSPGATVTMTGYRNGYFLPGAGGCSGCITQHYFGIRDVFSECNEVFYGSLIDANKVPIDKTFKAPKVPGVYYITQVGGWQYNCFDDFNGDPDTSSTNAIAVVVVEGANKVYAKTAASANSLIGDYPITIAGCNDLSNYDVSFVEGTLSVIADPCLARHWDGNRTYIDRIGSVVGNPVGVVTNGGLSSSLRSTENDPGRVGGVPTPYPNGSGGFYNANNSFRFNGTTSYIETGTAGSVSGTGDFSVSAWVNTTSTEPMVIISQRDGDINGEYILKVGGIHSYPASDGGAHPGKAYFLVYGSGVDDNNNTVTSPVVDLISTTSVNDGNWHFIKGERKGKVVRLYVDGVLEASGNTEVVINLNGNITTTIGRDARDAVKIIDNENVNINYFNGLIDDIKVSICSTVSARPVVSTIPANPPAAAIFGERVFPNPASHTVRIETGNSIRSVNDLQVSDLTGRMKSVRAKRIHEGLFELDISGLPGGMYFIRAKTATGMKTFRFIKL